MKIRRKTLNLTGLYPNKFIEHEVLETVDGTNEIYFRIFPLQYNESANRTYLYKNITFSFGTKLAEPKPPVRLSVTNDYVNETIVGSTTEIGIFVSNYGETSAKNVSIVENIPSGFDVSFVSGNGVYNSSTNTIVWDIDTISSWNFKMLVYELTAYDTGNYTINTTIEYTDENGTIYPQINISKSILVKPNQPPTIEISHPLEGATVSGTVTISGKASDPDGNETLAKVEIRIDSGGWNTASGTTSWSYDWDTTTVSNGQYTIHAKSYDGQNYSNETSITVTVDNLINNPPTVSISSPSEGATVSGTITISGTASDPDEGDSIERVEVQIDGGSWIATSGTTSWSYNWDTTTVSNGQHTISARSYDGEDHSTIVSRSVTVDNPIAPPNNSPTVSISNPTTGTTVSGTVTITGTASDPDGNETLTKVEVRIDSDSWKTVTGTTSWNYDWDATTVSNGEHTINAKSYDGKDYSEEASITVTVNNPIPNNPPVVSISHPSNGSTVSGTVTISGNASDSDGNETLVRMEIRIDSGNWKNATGTTSWSYDWNTKKTSNGNHTIEVRAWDGINYSSIDSIVLNVQNKKKEGIPGFEIIFLVAAITIVLLWKRKHR